MRAAVIPPARISLVTLGVADLIISGQFYEALGWRRRARAFEKDILFFALENLVLAVFPRVNLAKDACIADPPPGFSGVTLAINVDSKAEVDAVIATALAAGATIPKSPQRAEWGGYSGYFADPDGHLREVAHNPLFPLGSDGRVILPD